MRNFIILISGLIVIFATSGFSGCYVKVTEKHICIGPKDGIAFHTNADGSSIYSKEFDVNTQDLIPDLLKDKASYDIRFENLSLKIRSGSSDFSFVNAFTVEADSQGGSLSPLLLIDYAKNGNVVGTSNVLFLASREASTNLYPYLSQGPLKLNLQFNGQIPQGDWVVDADFCFSLMIQADLPPKN